jgi:O-antigen ligase
MVNNYLFRSDSYNEIFHIPFLLNIIVFIIITNVFSDNQNLFNNLFRVFSISTVLTSLCFIFGIGVDYFDGRLSVFMINSNILGVHAVICLFVIIRRFFDNKIKLLDIIFSPFLLLLLIETVSRSAFLLLFISVIYILFYSGRLTTYKRFYTIFILIFTSPLLFSYILDSFIFERFYLTFVEGDLSARDLVWSKLYNAFEDNFVFGFGQNGYYNLTELFGFSQNGGISPHNVFLEVFLYTGIIGLMLYSYFVFKTIRFSLIVKKVLDDITPLFFATIIFILSISGQILEQKLPWILLSYIFILHDHAKKTQN